jgi:hypothetical protein
MTQPSIFSTLYELNSLLWKNHIDPGSVGIVMKRDDFDRLKDAVSLENPSSDWNKGTAFHYAGLTFVDGSSWVYARAETSH